MHKTLSLKKNFAWAFVGNVVASFCFWVLLVVIAKLATAEVVGLFAIAQAIGLPISMLFNLNLQLVQVTDAKQDFSFGQYHAIKILTSMATAVTIAVVGFCFYPVDTAVVIMLSGIGYAIISYREVFLAVMQKSERMDKMTVSRIMQGVLSLVMFTLFFLPSRSLALGIWGLITARLITLFFYDMKVAKKLLSGEGGYEEILVKSFVPHWDKKRLWQLVKLAIPLGLVAWLGTFFTSIPRLVLDKYAGRDDVGYFSAMSSLLVVGTTIITALSQSVMPRMAKYYVENRLGYKLLVIKLVAVALLMGIASVIVSALFGKQILTILFTPEYAKHWKILTQLMVAGCVLLLFYCMNASLTSARKFAVQIPIYGICAALTGVSSILLIPRYGMLGAVWSLLICYIVGVAACLFFIILAIREK